MVALSFLGYEWVFSKEFPLIVKMPELLEAEFPADFQVYDLLEDGCGGGSVLR